MGGSRVLIVVGFALFGRCAFAEVPELEETEPDPAHASALHFLVGGGGRLMTDPAWGPSNRHVAVGFEFGWHTPSPKLEIATDAFFSTGSASDSHDNGQDDYSYSSSNLEIATGLRIVSARPDGAGFVSFGVGPSFIQASQSMHSNTSGGNYSDSGSAFGFWLETLFWVKPENCAGLTGGSFRVSYASPHVRGPERDEPGGALVNAGNLQVFLFFGGGGPR